MEWSLRGDLLKNGGKYQIKQRDTALELIIRDAVPEDSGVYTCVCREQRTKATVKVIGMLRSFFERLPPQQKTTNKQHLCLFSPAFPATFKVSLKSQEAEEGMSVRLRCELSKKGVPVHWQREGQVLSEEMSHGKYQMKLEERTALMTILNIQPGDAGKYSCITGAENTTAEVKVKRK